MKELLVQVMIFLVVEALSVGLILWGCSVGGVLISLGYLAYVYMYINDKIK